MPEPSVIHSTFSIERHYSAPPDRVWEEFADADKKRRWFAIGDHHDLQEFTMDFRPGGGERLRYRMKPGTPIAGAVITNSGSFKDIVTGKRIVEASTMSMGDKPFSVQLVTLEFLPNGDGTDLVFTHQGAFLEGSDGPRMREAGWQKMLAQVGAGLGK